MNDKGQQITTMYLDRQVHEALRRFAFEKRVPMTRIMEEALTEYFKKHNK